MNKILDIKFEGIYGPEYYMEIQGFDVRIAMKKFNDLIQTLGDAKLSLIYSDRNEHEDENVMEVNIIRRSHLRHAIIDLNNSFDLLLQIPWFFYRVWDNYNVGGQYYNANDRRYREIVRNTEDWVTIAENMCIYDKVHKFLSNNTDEELVIFDNKLLSFYNTFLFNSNKRITIRGLANMMKHKSAIRFEELSEPWNLTVEINDGTINPKQKGLEVRLDCKFYDEDKKDVDQGIIHFSYTDDIYLDIEYHNGESFRSCDYLDRRKIFSLDEVRDECVDYFNEIVNLYTDLFKIIENNIGFNPLMKVGKIEGSKRSVNLDKYFKA